MSLLHLFVCNNVSQSHEGVGGGFNVRDIYTAKRIIWKFSVLPGGDSFLLLQVIVHIKISWLELCALSSFTEIQSMPL